MLEFLLGLIVGIFFAPLIEILTTRYIASLSQRRRFTLEKREKVIEMTNTQIKIAKDALHKCVDLSWFNFALQRWFHELSKSDAYKDKLSRTILTKMKAASKTKIVKGVRIIDLDIGKEAPFFKSIQALTIQEYEKLIENRKNKVVDLKKEVKEEEENLIRTEKIKSASESSIEENFEFEETSTPSSVKEEICKQIEKITEDENKLSNEVFQRCYFLCELEYKGEFSFQIEVDLFGGYSMPVVGSIYGFEGPLLLKLPAQDYNTRLEVSFLTDPNFKYKIESGVSLKNEDMFLKTSMSSFLTKFMKYTLYKLYVYPNWYSQYLPNVIPSMREVKHVIEKIDESNWERVVKKITYDILLYLSMDYRIYMHKKKIVYRRINYFVNNTDDRIFCTHFIIPPEIYKNGEPEILDLFEDLTTEESKVLSMFYDWKIFEKVISGFENIKEVKKFNSKVSLIKIFFNTNTFEFIRIVHKDTLIFQSNNEIKPEFIIFKIKNDEIYIYQYGNTREYKLDMNRIKKLKLKMENKPFRTLGSSKLFKIMALTRKKTSKYFKKEKVENNENLESEIQLAEIKNMFVEMKKEMLTDSLQNKFLSKKSVKFKITAKELFHILSDDELRMKLMGDVFKITNFKVISNKIESYSLKKEAEDPLPIYSFKEDEGLIIDTDRVSVVHGFFIQDLEPDEVLSTDINNNSISSDGCVLTLFFTSQIPILLSNNFVFSLKLRINQQEFYKITDQFPYETLTLKSSIKRSVLVQNGSVYLEMKSEIDEDLYIYIYNKTKKNYLVEKVKVVLKQTASFLLHAPENSSIEISIIPKFFRNNQLNLKVMALESTSPDFYPFINDSFIRCHIGLNTNKKFNQNLFPFSDSSLFWDVDPETGLVASIDEGNGKVRITGCGLLLTKNKKYNISYKNMGPKRRDIRVFLGMANIQM